MGFVDLIKGSRSSYRVGQTTLVNSFSLSLYTKLCLAKINFMPILYIAVFSYIASLN